MSSEMWFVLTTKGRKYLRMLEERRGSQSVVPADVQVSHSGICGFHDDLGTDGDHHDGHAHLHRHSRKVRT